ncbi:glycosyltransferase family 4 protein [Mucilaginibacter gilvus]|uniref:Glycosyltransferase family 1 protein n=1 Tax=Mucilaginibacter gilvus TaxID=2305909 RepID=A0A444MLN9_9SPHI|nr:glycosyltransferase family 4 protein [Mucilaginibacter gilvus]RWY50200.1 glycosyltransferase family 1 protein [Mucilaginibacter gilvus]
MRILVVDELCPPQLGGIQVRFKGLAKQWAAMGHEVHVTAIDHLGTSSEKEVIDGINYHRIMKDDGYYKSGPFGRKVSTIFTYTFKLKPFFKQEWDLIIFCQFPMLPQIFYKLFYKKRAKTALDFVEYRGSRLWKIINNIILNAADQVICISNHVKQCVLEHRKDNLHIIPSFVDTTGAVSASKTNYIFMGRMVEHKHPEHAIQAVLAYNETYNKNMPLQMMGGGGMLQELKTEYAGNGCITFLGSVDDEVKQQVLANGRILILPSEREGLPIVVIEAMSYGVPTITTDYPGNGTQFFVTEEQIGKVAQPDVNDIAKKIKEIEDDYDAFVNRCNQIKDNYDTKVIAQKYLDIFR